MTKPSHRRLTGGRLNGRSSAAQRLYAYTVYFEVQFLYRDGVVAKGQPRVAGQIFSDRHKNVPVLFLRPVGWVHHESTPSEPLAILWHPVCVAVGYDTLCFRGIEAIQHGRSRQWVSQKWLCQVSDPQRARERARQSSGALVDRRS
jgi:hypothetical protein